MITIICNNGVKTSEKVRGGNIAKISYKQQKYNDYSRRKDNLIQKKHNSRQRKLDSIYQIIQINNIFTYMKHIWLFNIITYATIINVLADTE